MFIPSRQLGLCGTVVWTVAVVGWMYSVTAAEQDAVAPTVDELHAIWKERTRQAATAQFKMRSATHKSPATLVEPNEPLPKVGLTFDDPNVRLVIADNRLRHDSVIASLVGTKGPHTVQHYSAFNGKWQQTYSLEPDRPVTQQNGVRKPLKESNEWGALSLSPLVLAVRPLRQEAFGADAKTWKIDHEPVMLDDRPTWRLILELNKENAYRHEFYLEQQSPYRTLCMQGMRGEQCIVRVDIQYPEESTDEWPNWIPKTWADAWFAGTEARSLVSHTVDLVVLNQDVPDTEFDLTYPTGMLVIEGDEKGNEVRRWRSTGGGKLVPAK